MRWFKHIAVARRDEKLAGVHAAGGPAAYGLYFLVLEVIAEHMETSSSKCAVSYPVSVWARELGIRSQDVRRKLAPHVAAGLIEMGEAGAEGIVKAHSSRAKLTIAAPNLLKYRDEYSSRVGTKSRQPHEPDLDLDSDSEKEKRKRPPPPTPAPRGGGLEKTSVKSDEQTPSLDPELREAARKLDRLRARAKSNDRGLTPIAKIL